MRAAIEAVLGRAVGDLVVLGQGTDHVAVEVEGELVARLPVASDGGGELVAGVEREVRVLGVVGELSPVAVPVVVAADPGRGVIVTRKVSGVSLLGRSLAVDDRVVEQLAALIVALHCGPVDGFEVDDYPLDRYLADAADARPDVDPWLSAEQRRRVDDFLAQPPPPEPDPAGFVLSHNDLGAEHLLVDAAGTRLTGVIDWSDAAVTDPARDLGKVHRDLGPAATATILRALGHTADADDDLRRRIVFHARCALLEDLAHATTAGAPEYAHAALASFPHTF